MSTATRRCAMCQRPTDDRHRVVCADCKPNVAKRAPIDTTLARIDAALAGHDYQETPA